MSNNIIRRKPAIAIIFTLIGITIGIIIAIIFSIRAAHAESTTVVQRVVFAQPLFATAHFKESTLAGRFQGQHFKRGPAHRPLAFGNAHEATATAHRRLAHFDHFDSFNGA